MQFKKKSIFFCMSFLFFLFSNSLFAMEKENVVLGIVKRQIVQHQSFPAAIATVVNNLNSDNDLFNLLDNVANDSQVSLFSTTIKDQIQSIKQASPAQQEQQITAFLHRVNDVESIITPIILDQAQPFVSPQVLQQARGQQKSGGGWGFLGAISTFFGGSSSQQTTSQSAAQPVHPVIVSQKELSKETEAHDVPQQLKNNEENEDEHSNHIEQVPQKSLQERLNEAIKKTQSIKIKKLKQRPRAQRTRKPTKLRGNVASFNEPTVAPQKIGVVAHEIERPEDVDVIEAETFMLDESIEIESDELEQTDTQATQAVHDNADLIESMSDPESVESNEQEVTGVGQQVWYGLAAVSAGVGNWLGFNAQEPQQNQPQIAETIIDADVQAQEEPRNEPAEQPQEVFEFPEFMQNMEIDDEELREVQQDNQAVFDELDQMNPLDQDDDLVPEEFRRQNVPDHNQENQHDRNENQQNNLPQQHVINNNDPDPDPDPNGNNGGNNIINNNRGRAAAIARGAVQNNPGLWERIKGFAGDFIREHPFVSLLIGAGIAGGLYKLATFISSGTAGHDMQEIAQGLMELGTHAQQAAQAVMQNQKRPRGFLTGKYCEIGDKVGFANLPKEKRQKLLRAVLLFDIACAVAPLRKKNKQKSLQNALQTFANTLPTIVQEDDVQAQKGAPQQKAKNEQIGSILGRFGKYIAKNPKALLGIGLAGYSLIAHLKGWPPFHQQPVPQQNAPQQPGAPQGA